MTTTLKILAALMVWILMAACGRAQAEMLSGIETQATVTEKPVKISPQGAREVCVWPTDIDGVEVGVYGDCWLAIDIGNMVPVYLDHQRNWHMATRDGDIIRMRLETDPFIRDAAGSKEMVILPAGAKSDTLIYLVGQRPQGQMPRARQCVAIAQGQVTGAGSVRYNGVLLSIRIRPDEECTQPMVFER